MADLKSFAELKQRSEDFAKNISIEEQWNGLKGIASNLSSIVSTIYWMDGSFAGIPVNYKTRDTRDRLTSAGLFYKDLCKIITSIDTLEEGEQKEELKSMVTEFIRLANEDAPTLLTEGKSDAKYPDGELSPLDTFLQDQAQEKPSHITVSQALKGERGFVDGLVIAGGGVSNKSLIDAARETEVGMGEDTSLFKM